VTLLGFICTVHAVVFYPQAMLHVLIIIDVSGLCLSVRIAIIVTLMTAVSFLCTLVPVGSCWFLFLSRLVSTQLAPRQAYLFQVTYVSMQLTGL